MRPVLSVGFWCGVLALALHIPQASAAPAEAGYPERPVRIMVPFTPGSGMDILARSVGNSLAAELGQPFVVENRPGAAGNIGTTEVAKAKPDGYTLLLQITTLAINPSLYRHLPWAIDDFEPVAMIARGTPIALTASLHAPFGDANEMITAAKAEPGKFNYASPGVGTPQHLAMEFFMNRAGIDVFHVPYKSTQDILSQMFKGDVQLAFLPVHVATPLAADGRLRILAVDGAERWHELPQIPTFQELGLGEMAVSPWYGLFAPAGTPAAIVQRLQDAVLGSLNDAKARQDLLARGLIARPAPAQDFGELVRTDARNWRDIIERAGIVIE